MNLPPALVETNPLPLSDVGPKTAFTFYFNQPMERGSVQEAMQAQPAWAGSFKWTDDATVTFTPDKPLTPGAGVLVSFTTRARAANGQALAAPIDVPFQVSSGFSLVDLLPRPGSTDVNPTSAVVATFNRPVVALGADSKSLPAPFTIEPAAKGRGEWLNTSTYIFYPDLALQGGSEYTVRQNTGLTGVDGTGWADSSNLLNWKFKTALPALQGVSPDGKTPLALDGSITLTFNQPMDAASVQAALAIQAPGGVNVPGKLAWNETATQVTWQANELLKRATQYTLVLSGKAQAKGGAALGKDFSLTYTSVPDFAVKMSEPANGGILKLFDVYGGIRIQFTTPLPEPKQDLTSQISVVPAIGDMNIAQYAGNEIYVSGIFKPRTDYTVTLQTGLKDKWGQALKEPVVIQFKSAEPPASLGLAQATGNGVVFFNTRGDRLSRARHQH